LRLPSGYSRSRDSSQCPYSAWSVSMRLAASLEVPRGMYSTMYEYSAINLLCAIAGVVQSA